MKLALAVLTVGMAASSSIAVAGPCAMPSPRVVVLTPDGAKIDQHMGILVGVVEDFAEAKTPNSLDGLDWKFGATAASRVDLAPGLALLQPAKEPAADGPLALVDGKQQPVVSVAFAHARVTHGFLVPKLKSVTFASSQGPRSSYQSTTAVLDAAVPGAVAVLAYLGRDLAAKKPALAWARLDPKAPSPTVTLASYSRCSVPVGGGSPPTQGDRVVLVFVRGDGTLSSPSNEVTVK